MTSALIINKPSNLQKHDRKTPTQGVMRGQQKLLSQHHPDGYWWHTLEANDSICAEFIMLAKYLDLKDIQTEQAICRWIMRNQNLDGSWSLYHKGPGDLSSTVECYMALKLAGFDPKHPSLIKAREFILSNGGITKIRVFSRIHLAIFGLADWKICPNMPIALIQLPDWAPINIYDFSSWARASIVPLLVIMDQKKTKLIPGFSVDELYVEDNPKKVKWTYEVDAGLLSLEKIFLNVDKALQVVDKLKFKPLRKISLKKCEKYIREHVAVTEDIWPAMFYSILALYSLGNTLEDENIQKALLGLRSFHVILNQDHLIEIPFKDDTSLEYNVIHKSKPIDDHHMIYQQCCISPVWDTAWAGVALLKSGLRSDDQRIITTARWLLSKQVTDMIGDWGVKNPRTEPGGWSFEFNNKHYPDVDDTIEVITFLSQVDLPYRELKKPIERGINWLLSMQCKNGGFAAFDKDNDKEILNKIPFSDHGACLDQATVDITGRMIEFLIRVCEFDLASPVIQRAADFIRSRQEKDGSFWGRWGVNYLYGTWCVLEGLGALGSENDKMIVSRAIHWLKSIQNPDGGFGESCESYQKNQYVPLNESTPSQTAWALMALIAVGQTDSQEARQAAQYLISNQNEDGGWDEDYFTGTGFPGHFYIRYHGYRYYFPLLALARYLKKGA